jgi:hypothetical protein
LSLAVVVIELIDTILYATVAGIGLTVIFSMAIYGATRCVDLGRDNRPLAAIGAGIFGALSFLVCVAAAVAGIIVMLE